MQCLVDQALTLLQEYQFGNSQINLLKETPVQEVFLSASIPCTTEQPIQGIESQEKEVHNDQGIQEICSERCYSEKWPAILEFKGKHPIDRKFQSLAVREKKLLT